MKEPWSGDGDEGGMEGRWILRKYGVEMEMNDRSSGDGDEGGMEWRWR